MKSGIMRHRIILQSPAGARDSVGERTTTWANIATVWASINPLSARDLIAAGQTQNETTHRVRLRDSTAIAAIDASWRVMFGARIFVITSVRRIDEVKNEIELLCSEGVRTE